MLAIQKEEKENFRGGGGGGGFNLPSRFYKKPTPPLLSGLPHVQLLRQIWVQHYFWEEQQLRLRKKDMLPPAHLIPISVLREHSKMREVSHRTERLRVGFHLIQSFTPLFTPFSK